MKAMKPVMTDLPQVLNKYTCIYAVPSVAIASFNPIPTLSVYLKMKTSRVPTAFGGLQMTQLS